MLRLPAVGGVQGAKHACILILFDSFFCRFDLYYVFDDVCTFSCLVYIFILQEPKGKLMQVSTMYFS